MASRGYCCVGSDVVVYGLSCPEADRNFLDQGLNPCPLHWQVDSVPLDHQKLFWEHICDLEYKHSPPENICMTLHVPGGTTNLGSLGTKFMASSFFFFDSWEIDFELQIHWWGAVLACGTTFLGLVNPSCSAQF